MSESIWKMAPFLDSNPKEVMAALSSKLRQKRTIDVDASSLIGVEEVEGDLSDSYFLLRDTVLGPCLGIESALGGGSGRLALGGGRLILDDLAH
jgi:hypothetical protein